MSTHDAHRVGELRAANWRVVRTAAAAVLLGVAGVLLWGSPLRVAGVWCVFGALGFALALRGPVRQRRRLPGILAARAQFEHAYRCGWQDAQLLDHALSTGAVLTERPAGMLVLDPNEYVHVRVFAPASVSHAPAEPVEITLTTHALVTVFANGHLARWYWSAATGLRIDLAQGRIDLYWAGTGDSIHIYGPHAPLVAIYAAWQVWSPEQYRTSAELRPLRAGAAAAQRIPL